MSRRCDGDEWEMGDAPADAEASHHDTEFPSTIYIRGPHMNLGGGVRINVCPSVVDIHRPWLDSLSPES